MQPATPRPRSLGVLQGNDRDLAALFRSATSRSGTLGEKARGRPGNLATPSRRGRPGSRQRRAQQERREYTLKHPPPLGLVAHPDGSAHRQADVLMADGRGDYSIELLENNIVSVALVVPSSVVCKASLFAFLRSSGRWEQVPHAVFSMHFDARNEPLDGREELCALLNSLDALGDQPQQHRLVLRVMLPAIGQYQLRFHWGNFPGDPQQIRHANTALALHEHPLRVGIQVGPRVPGFRTLLPSFFHPSCMRYGYPVKHALAEHYGLFLLEPMRFRLRMGHLRFAVLVYQGKPASAGSPPAPADAEAPEGTATATTEASAKTAGPKAKLGKVVAVARSIAGGAGTKDIATPGSKATPGASAGPVSPRAGGSSGADDEELSGLGERLSAAAGHEGGLGVSEAERSRRRGTTDSVREPRSRPRSSTKMQPELDSDEEEPEAKPRPPRPTTISLEMQRELLLEAVQRDTARSFDGRIRGGSAGQVCIVAVFGAWRRVELLRRRCLPPPAPPEGLDEVAATVGSNAAALLASQIVREDVELHEAVLNVTEEDHGQPVQLFVFQVGNASAIEAAASARAASLAALVAGDLPGLSPLQQSSSAAVDAAAAAGENAEEPMQLHLGRVPAPGRWCLAEFFVEGASPLPFDEEEMDRPPQPARDAEAFLALEGYNVQQQADDAT